MTDKEKIGQEIRLWLDKDPNYTRVLIPYALEIGAITNEEAEACIVDLDRYYQATGASSEHKNKVFAALIPELGFSKCKILYNIVEQLPLYHAEGTTLFPNDEKIRKIFDKMSTQHYYLYINELDNMGYITKGKQGRRKTYTINFDKMESVYSIVNNNRIQ